MNTPVKTTNYPFKFGVDAHNVHAELSKYILADGFGFVLDLHESQGEYMHDAASDKRFLDFFTCFASMPIGMNHPKLQDKNFVQYLGEVALNKPSNSDIYTSEMATFVKTFFELAVPKHFKYSFFIEGGALANENALKVAFDWKVRKNFAKGYTSEKGHSVMHFRQAFHGRSGYTMTLTNTAEDKVKYFPKFNNWPRITNPAMMFPLTPEHMEHTIALEKKALEEIKSAYLQNKDDISCVIIEPIQGEGGDNHFRPEFLQALRDIAHENDSLLIFDEVQTGVGITGTWWAHEQLGVAPDIMSFGKKMQVCGIVVGEKVDEVPDNVFHVPSRINSTWGGNLVDMVRSAKYLEIIHEENMVGNAASTGAYLQNKLTELTNEFPEVVSNARGRGLFCAFDIKKELRADFIQHCYNHNLIILACGDHSIRFRPALNITPAIVDQGMNIIRDAVKTIA